MENLLQFVVIALLAETVWENLKMIWQNGKFNPDRIGALVISIVITVSTGIDLFAALNFNISIPVLGSILTGILISRGANVMHDLLKKIQALSKEEK